MEEKSHQIIRKIIREETNKNKGIPGFDEFMQRNGLKLYSKVWEKWNNLYDGIFLSQKKPRTSFEYPNDCICLGYCYVGDLETEGMQMGSRNGFQSYEYYEYYDDFNKDSVNKAVLPLINEMIKDKNFSIEKWNKRFDDVPEKKHRTD